MQERLKQWQNNKDNVRERINDNHRKWQRWKQRQKNMGNGSQTSIENKDNHIHWSDMKTTSVPVFNEIEMVRQALNCLSC